MTNRTVKTTERSLRVIEEVQRLDGATLNELSESMNMARSTIHKHLVTLSKSGYLDKDGEIYTLGLKFLNHGEHVRTKEPAYTLARETVNDIAKETDEEVDFVALSDGRGITIHESYHPHSPFRKDVEETNRYGGQYYYLHRIAAGKAILAELPEERVFEIIDQWGLPPRTDQSITSVETLLEELGLIRERGISYSDEEFADGLRAVARRVKRPDGSLLGAISVSAPMYRMASELFEEEIPSLLRGYVDELESNIEDDYPYV